MTHHLKFLSLIAIASLACAASAQTTIIDKDTLNGSFETGTGSGVDSLDFWTFAAPAVQTNRSGGLVSLGSQSAILGRFADLDDNGDPQPTLINGLLQNTGYTVSSGDIFNLSFDWSGASRWDTADAIDYRLFTTSDDTIAGTATEILGGSVSGFTSADGFQSVNVSSIIGKVTAAIQGRDLWIEFIGAPTNVIVESEFARLDNVVIVSIPEPSAYALLAGMLGLTWVMVRRR
jgi:hypothetical protein